MGKLGDFLKRQNIFGSLASGLGSIVDMIGQNKVVDKQIAAQREENRLNRYYNQMLARQQNQWNLEQWQRENYYNSPAAQMYRLRQAGLNPDLMYGQGTTGNSAGSPEMTSGASSEPQDMASLLSKRSLGQTLSMSIEREQQRRMTEAQIEAIKANTKKTEEETAGVSLDNLIKEGTKDNVIKLSSVTLEGAMVLNDLNQAQRASLLKGIEKASQDIKESQSRVEAIKASIANMAFEQQQDLKRLVLEALRNDAEIRNLDADTERLIADAGLTRQQYYEAVETFALREAGLLKDNEIKDKQVAKLVSEVDILRNEFQSGSLKLQKDIFKNRPFVKTDLSSRLISVGYSAISLISSAIRGQ